MDWHIHYPFPVSALGTTIGNAVWQHHGNSRLSVELIAPFALGLAAAAVQDLYDVQRPNMAPSPSSLFVKVVASTGEGKDAGAAPFLAPFLKFQAEADAQFEEVSGQYDVELFAWRAQEKILVTEMEQLLRVDGNIDDLKLQLGAHLAERPCRPRAPLVIYDDATVSSIKESLCERWRSGAVVSMEAGDILNGRLGVAYPFFNAGWGGQPIFSDRVAEGRRSVHAPRLGMVVGIQPEPCKRFLKQRGLEAHDSGFTARFLISVPPSTKGQRFIGAWQASTGALDAYAARVTELLWEGAALTLAGSERRVLKFTPEAAEHFVAIYNTLQTLIAPGGVYAEISGQAAKAAENVARVAAVLHVIDRLIGDISLDTLKRAAVILEWFTNQFLAFFSGLAQTESPERDALVVESALQRGRFAGHAMIRRSELRYWCPPNLKTSRIDRGLRVLLNHSRVEFVRHKGCAYVTLRDDRLLER